MSKLRVGFRNFANTPNKGEKNVLNALTKINFRNMLGSSWVTRGLLGFRNVFVQVSYNPIIIIIIIIIITIIVVVQVLPTNKTDNPLTHTQSELVTNTRPVGLTSHSQGLSHSISSQQTFSHSISSQQTFRVTASQANKRSESHPKLTNVQSHIPS